MKQTAVEWFEKELQKNFNIEGVQPLYDDIFEQAKEMEKEQQDEFAIKFTDWCEDYYYPSSAKDIWYDKPDFSNAKKFTTKELLEIFKNK